MTLELFNSEEENDSWILQDRDVGFPQDCCTYFRVHRILRVAFNLDSRLNILLCK